MYPTTNKHDLTWIFLSRWLTIKPDPQNLKSLKLRNDRFPINLSIGFRDSFPHQFPHSFHGFPPKRLWFSIGLPCIFSQALRFPLLFPWFFRDFSWFLHGFSTVSVVLRPQVVACWMPPGGCQMPDPWRRVPGEVWRCGRRSWRPAS